MRFLVTGGAGFIGSNFVRHLLEHREGTEVVNLDALTYAGNLENLKDLEDDPRYRFVHGDIRDPEVVAEAMEGIDVVVNFAAESHVDRSIVSAFPFLRTNVEGTLVLLEAARAHGVGRFVQVSTDEVYGSLEWRDPSDPGREEDDPGREEDGSGGREHDEDVEYFTEETPLAPRSPYSASKAAADHLVEAYHHTHGLDTVVTRSSNNYGPYQFPEKLIPLMITNALEGKELPVYGDGLNVRDWIHVGDHCRGIVAAAEHGNPGEAYNFGGRAERTNIGVVRAILDILGMDEGLLTFIEDRPGHDRRYAIDPTKAERELGWRPETTFEEGLERTVGWYRNHEEWWRRVKDGEYRDYYERMYGSS